MKAQKRTLYPVQINKQYYSGGVIVSPSDTVDLEDPIEGFMVSAVATVVLTTFDNNKLTLTGLLPGYVYPILTKRIWSTGTTGGIQIVGLLSSF